MFFEVCLLSAVCVAATLGEPVSYPQATLKCGAAYNLTAGRPNELDYFLVHGEFPAGKQGMKCIHECIARATDTVDANFVPDADKLKAMVKRNPKVTGLKLFASPEVLRRCLQPKDRSSPCDIAYDFVKCASAVKRNSRT